MFLDRGFGGEQLGRSLVDSSWLGSVGQFMPGAKCCPRAAFTIVADLAKLPTKTNQATILLDSELLRDLKQSDIRNRISNCEMFADYQEFRNKKPVDDNTIPH